MKKNLLLCDMVIGKNLCNASCEYCLTNYDQYDPGKMTALNAKYIYKKGTVFHERINKIIDSLQNNFNIAAFKISGGEILMVKNIIELLEERADQFINVKLMTNGILLNKDIIARLSGIPNIYLQISIDSHDFAGNYYRNKNKNVHERILKNIDEVVKNNIPLEINCVLNNRSIENILGFLDYLKQYENYPLKIFPFPVRGDEFAKYFPQDEQVKILDEVINKLTVYEKIVPPLAYWEGLKNFVQKKFRQRICMIPFHTMQFFDDGQFTPCPYWWTVELGNLIQDGEEVLNKYCKEPIYRMLLAKRPKLNSCNHCYIRSEILNLFFENVLTITDIKTIPFYEKPDMIKFIEVLKNDYLNIYGKA